MIGKTWVYAGAAMLLSTGLAGQAGAQSFTENFDDITTLSGNGWAMQNHSNPIGLQANWFQGTPVSGGGPFNAYNGATNAYIAANYQNTSGNNTISNWLLTPNRTFRNGDTLSFYTRKPIGTDYPDRLEVRLSANGASTNVGGNETSVGDFTTLLLSINPTLATGVYPTSWTLFTATVSGLPAPTSGRAAFRYFVTNGGPTGQNSDYIGIDNVVYTPYVCPTLTVSPGGGPLTAGKTGQGYTNTLGQSGALGAPNFAITAGALPSGLTLSSSGTISGTPTALGTFNFTVDASDASGCSGSQSYSIEVDPGPPPAPAGVGATAGDTTANVSWTAMSVDPYGVTISGYAVTAVEDASRDAPRTVRGPAARFPVWPMERATASRSWQPASGEVRQPLPMQ